ncbi:uncharacterized protein LOC134740882 [Cydia strobilella]|uniref:uncharacterized protein LOC134740882 n=1 Tax=Cydia strobilella TaxID=1100964 RepID=UPI003005FEF7
MTPLARSLVAFAALLAAADASSSYASADSSSSYVSADSNPFCNSVATGTQSSYGQPWQRPSFVFELFERSGKVNIPDKCSRSGKKLVAQSIYGCSIRGPPAIFVDGQFSPVTITCPNIDGGCSLNISQFCE